MAKMNKQALTEFLAEPRYGILTSLRQDGSPISVPVWFEWDGEVVRIFTGSTSPKVARIKNDPRITLLVSNHMDEYEAWVSFDGEATILDEGGMALAERLAARYWDLSDPQRQETLESWRKVADHFCLIELKPKRIRSYWD